MTTILAVFAAASAGAGMLLGAVAVLLRRRLTREIPPRRTIPIPH